jgi:pentatricopeptide repeat protein
MLDMGVPPDGYSVTQLMTLPSNPEKITSLLKRIEPSMTAKHNPAAYRSIISAYGKAGDPSSACWVFEEMMHSRRIQGRNAEGWNVILGALANGCADANEEGNGSLDILNSSAARSRKHLRGHNDEPEHMLLSRLDGESYLDASMAILGIMRNGTAAFGPEGLSVPKPNSQSYCLVASALSGYGTSAPHPDRAIKLFRNATKEGVPADGRFLNAVLRCYGDDVEGALAAWKSDFGPAAAAHESRGRTKAGTNLIAAYHGLMHVCGRALRPDVATRIAYAMNKAGVEPTEASLNNYVAGKRVALRGKDDAKSLGLRDQYETLLSVECMKCNIRDKRQDKDKKIRIIW